MVDRPGKMEKEPRALRKKERVMLFGQARAAHATDPIIVNNRTAKLNDQ